MSSSGTLGLALLVTITSTARQRAASSDSLQSFPIAPIVKLTARQLSCDALGVKGDSGVGKSNIEHVRHSIEPAASDKSREGSHLYRMHIHNFVVVIKEHLSVRRPCFTGLRTSAPAMSPLRG